MAWSLCGSRCPGHRVLGKYVTKTVIRGQHQALILKGPPAGLLNHTPTIPQRDVSRPAAEAQLPLYPRALRWGGGGTHPLHCGSQEVLLGNLWKSLPGRSRARTKPVWRNCSRGEDSRLGNLHTTRESSLISRLHFSHL